MIVDNGPMPLERIDLRFGTNPLKFVLQLGNNRRWECSTPLFHFLIDKDLQPVSSSQGDSEDSDTSVDKEQMQAIITKLQEKHKKVQKDLNDSLEVKEKL